MQIEQAIALNNIPITIDLPSIKKELRIKPGTDSEKRFDALAKTTQDIGRPKAIYRVAYIDSKGFDTVTIENVTFTSPVMRKNLDDVNRVFCYVATCGIEVLEISKPVTDFLENYWLSQLRMELLRNAENFLQKEIQRAYQIGSLSTMNPGSGEAHIWRIEQQRALFSLLGDVQNMIGVDLMPSYLMHPDMSTSGIHFEKEHNYSNCQLCQRVDCPNRQAPFDEALWTEMHSKNN